jgi:hypothetical protein
LLLKINLEKDEHGLVVRIGNLNRRIYNTI